MASDYSRTRSLHPMIVVQRIRTEWTKDSRGGDSASTRNATPDALELPLLADPRTGYLLHDVRYCESKQYVADATRTESSGGIPVPIEPLLLSVAKREVVTRFVWSWHHCGAPERNSHDMFRLRVGQWGRFTCNGRFGAQSTAGREWSYHKTVFNVAFLEIFDEQVFTRTPPSADESAIASLR